MRPEINSNICVKVNLDRPIDGHSFNRLLGVNLRQNFVAILGNIIIIE